MHWKRNRTTQNVTINLIEFLAEMGNMPEVGNIIPRSVVVDAAPGANYTVSELTDDPAVVVAAVYTR